MRSKKEIKEVLEAWQNSPIHGLMDTEQDAIIAGRTIIDILKWILEED